MFASVCFTIIGRRMLFYYHSYAMRVFDHEAIVVSGSRLGEADKILTLLTPKAGRVKAVAKGVRKTKSRFGGRLEALNHLDISLYQGKSLYTVTSAHCIEVFPRMRASLARLEAGLACAEAAARAVHEGQPAAPQFAHLLEALRALDKCDPGPTFFVWFLMVLSRISGFAFHLDCCVGCGADSQLEFLSIPDGGAVCRQCRSRYSCFKIDPQVLEVMRSASDDAGSTAPPPDVARVATHASIKLFEYHLEDRLRSFRVVSGLGMAK
ncbi:MAG: DNA repair protein RecO [Acidimicrobiia bacterium]